MVSDVIVLIVIVLLALFSFTSDWLKGFIKFLVIGIVLSVGIVYFGFDEITDIHPIISNIVYTAYNFAMNVYYFFVGLFTY